MEYTLTAKSQVTLPKAIRSHLRVAPGDAVRFKIMADGGVRVEPVARPAKGQARALAAARKHFESLVGSGGLSGFNSTDELMCFLRGYDEDVNDPGFADPHPGINR